MRWPRGKYNGQRIVGVNVKVSINIRQWWWCLHCKWGLLIVHVGPFHSWTTAEYQPEYRTPSVEAQG